MSADSRRAAIRILSDVLEDELFLDDAASRRLPESEYDERDRALSYNLAIGSIRHLLELDALISRFSDTPIRKLDKDIKNILRISLFQLIYLTQIPDYAAVNEAVRLASGVRRGRYKGFVNGVIRSFIREREKLGYEALLDEILSKSPLTRSLSIRYSMPEWIVKLWLSRFGEDETKRLLLSFDGKRAVSLYVNTNRISAKKELEAIRAFGCEAYEASGIKNAITLCDGARPYELPGFDEGYFYICDLSSMQPPVRAGITEGDKVLDMCAAPGGKSVIASVLCGKTGEVTARDKSEKRLKSVEENIKRLGLKNIRTKAADALIRYPGDKEAYDVVLADLPCSGLGVLKHKPEIRYRLKSDDIISLSKLQGEILKNAYEAVRPGGTLVYSTCTISEAENEDNTKKLLASHPDLSLASEEQIFPDDTQDGFYIAIMRRAV